VPPLAVLESRLADAQKVAALWAEQHAVAAGRDPATA
jgi:hypothetical protein